MKLAITGALGHIGSRFIHGLRLGEFAEVRLIDNLATQRYASLFRLPGGVPIRFFEADILTADLAGLFSGCDAVIHLAALSNDPLSDLNPALTFEINHEASVHLARCARDAGVKRFLFSSSCSTYGASGDAILDETASFNPVTPYGSSKVFVERDVGALASDTFSPAFLRNATAYGVSPRMRFDLVLNNLVAWACATGMVYLKSDGTPWRPLVHVEDIARAFVAVLEAPRELVHNEAFNVGSDGPELTIRDLLRQILDPEFAVTTDMRSATRSISRRSAAMAPWWSRSRSRTADTRPRRQAHGVLLPPPHRQRAAPRPPQALPTH